MGLSGERVLAGCVVWGGEAGCGAARLRGIVFWRFGGYKAEFDVEGAAVLKSWADAYEPILSAPIRSLAWYPISSDTPGLVADLEKTSLCYSGGALILCENEQQIFLTWMQKGDQYCLTASGRAEQDWAENSLDRIQCSGEDPWGKIRGSAISRIEFYALADDELGSVVGVKHILDGLEGSFFVWIGTGGDGFIGDADDLWVSIGVEPTNRSSLIEVLTLAAAPTSNLD